jgi:cytochrome c
MKRIGMIVALGLALAAVGAAQANEELAKKSGCLNCHNVSGAKKIGPSFKDAAKDGEEKILAALKDPKKHGAVKASDEDKAALAKWVAGMK